MDNVGCVNADDWFIKIDGNFVLEMIKILRNLILGKKEASEMKSLWCAKDLIDSEIF